VIIGTGLQVTGRGSNGHGTILPAFLEWERDGNSLGKILMVGTNQTNSVESKIKAINLFQMAGLEFD